MYLYPVDQSIFFLIINNQYFIYLYNYRFYQKMESKLCNKNLLFNIFFFKF